VAQGGRELDDTQQLAGTERPAEELRPGLLRRQLAARLDLEPEALNALGTDAMAHLLVGIRDADATATVAPFPRSVQAPAPDLDLVPRVLRAELAEQLDLDPARLSALGPRAAAALLARLAGAGRASSRPAPGRAAPRPRDVERRDLVNRTLRDELARELNVPSTVLAGVSSDVVALAFHRLTLMAAEVVAETDRFETGQAEPERPPERREPIGRVLREELAGRLGIPARELSGLTVGASALLLRRLQEEGRRTRALEQQARTDELTGTLRREPGMEALRVEIGRARRLADFRFVVAFLNVEGLEAVSAVRGHARADQLVKELSTAILGRLRAHDLVMRWGGDEFVCAAAQTDADSARAIFEQVRTQFEAAADGCRLGIGVSVLEEGDTASDLVHRAEQNLIQSRRKPAPAPAGIEAANGGLAPVRPRPWWRR
jgi:diguanylate cyclase (GGDEF)-like protein